MFDTCKLTHVLHEYHTLRVTCTSTKGNKKTMDAMHQRSPLKKFDVEKSDNIEFEHFNLLQCYHKSQYAQLSHN